MYLNHAKIDNDEIYSVIPPQQNLPQLASQQANTEHLTDTFFFFMSITTTIISFAAHIRKSSEHFTKNNMKAGSGGGGGRG